MVLSVRHVLDDTGFTEAKSDASLFIYRCGDETVYLLLYVDDIVLTASSQQLLQSVISSMQREFAMKDLGQLHHFLGVTVEPRPSGLLLHQRQDRKSTRLNSSHCGTSRMPSSA